MPRTKSEERKKAKKDYIRRNGEVVLKKFAAEIGVSAGTIRNWKMQDRWDDYLDKVSLLEPKNVTEKNIRKKHRSSNKGTGSKGTVGNKGGGAPIGNKNALKHGAYVNLMYKDLDFQTQMLMQAYYEGTQQLSTESLEVLSMILDQRILGLLTRKTTTVRDMFGNEHTVEVTEEGRSKELSMLLDSKAKLERVILDAKVKQQLLKFKEKENKQKDKKLAIDRERLELDKKRLNFADDDGNEYGVVVLPQQSIGKENEEYIIDVEAKEG